MEKRVLIFGIGKFGSALAEKFLQQLNINLELIDKNQLNLNKFIDSDLQLHPINTENKSNIKEIGIQPEDICMVLFGTDIGASVITVQNLLDLKIKNIYVQIINKQHKKIIKSLGITKTIEPNTLAAEKISFAIGKNLDITCFDDQNYICRIKNQKIHDKKINELKLREKYGVNILLIKRTSEEGETDFIQPKPMKKIMKNDELILWITKSKIDKISNIF